MKSLVTSAYCLVVITLNSVAGGAFTNVVIEPGQAAVQDRVFAIAPRSHDDNSISFTVTCDAEKLYNDIRYSGNSGPHLQFRRGDEITLECALRPNSVSDGKAIMVFRVPTESLREACFTYAPWNSDGKRFVFNLLSYWNYSRAQTNLIESASPVSSTGATNNSKVKL
jgi:hypothetical protein